MKTVKTCELIGPALDWAVAKIEDVHIKFEFYGDEIDILLPGTEDSETGVAEFWAPSNDWSQGGPLIEKYEVDIVSMGQWEAMIDDHVYPWITYGSTPLIAACRAIVASKLGDTVQIPDELWTAQNDTAPPSRPDGENAGLAN